MTEENRGEVPAATQDELAALVLRTQDELDEMEAHPKYGIAFFLLGSMTTLFGLLLVLMCGVAAVLGLAFAKGAMVGTLAPLLALAAVQGAMGLGMFRYHRGLLEELRQTEHRLDRLLAGGPNGVLGQASTELEPMSFREYVQRNVSRIRSRFGGGEWVDDLITYGPGAAAGVFLTMFYPDHFLWIMVGVAAVSVALAELRKRRQKKRWEEDAPALEPPADDLGDRGSEDRD